MRIALLGDIALFGRMSIKNNPYLKEYFSKISEYLSHFDYVVGNLETPFSIKKKTYGAKSAFICSDIENVEILKLLHIKAVCLANNHMFDFGVEGYETTKDLLEKNGIDYFGAEGRELRIDKDGEKISFSGYCCYSSGPLKCVPSGDYGVNAYNLKAVETCLLKNNKDGFLNIVAVHAGKEHVNYPSIDHIRAARKLADKVEYIYYGHHPHVIQGIEEYKGSLIAYSLGNFCFDDIFTKASGDKPLITLSENNRHGLILELVIEDNKLIKWSEQVIYISKEGTMKLLKDFNELKEYNEALYKSEDDIKAYSIKRDAVLNARAIERRGSRNIAWYLRRLTPMYIKLYMDSKTNKKNYITNVLNNIING